jgi:hypothetical protein
VVGVIEYGEDYSCEHGEAWEVDCAKCSEPEPLNVTNTAVAAGWLKDNLGRGRLAGIFRRGAAGVLVHTPSIGQRGYQQLRGALVDGDDGPAQVRPIEAQAIAARVQYGWMCFRVKDDKPSPGMFPLSAAKLAASVPDLLPHVRSLRGVVHAPIVRRDGTILERPGYDRETALLYLPQPGLTVPPVPDRPTPREITDARQRILWPLVDFPFETDHDRAAFIGSALLTPLMRDLTPPPYKALAINARQMGSGKSLLAAIAAIVHGGVFRSETPEDDAELRKQITTILDMTTAPLVNFDNVTGVLKSGTLAGLLTSAAWDDRKLGANELARCVNDRVWMFTGNNVQLGGDMVRRTVWASIDPGMPNPELRTGFKIANLEEYVRAHQGQIICDLLTLIRAWVVAGRPGERVSSDSYAEWLRVVNGILSVAGISGRFDAKEARQQEEGEDDADWAEFLDGVYTLFGEREWTAKELLLRVSLDQENDFSGPLMLAEKLPRALAARAHKERGASHLAKSLGRFLKNRKGRWCGGKSAVLVAEGAKGCTWKVQIHQ